MRYEKHSVTVGEGKHGAGCGVPRLYVKRGTPGRGRPGKEGRAGDVAEECSGRKINENGGEHQRY